MRAKRIFMVLFILFLFTTNCFAANLNGVYEVMSGFSKAEDNLKSVVIALIDTGISPERLDEKQILDGKNYVSDTLGDKVGHGTKIASLIIGATDGEDAISALAPNARLVPLVYYSEYPSGVPINGGVEAICQGIYDAIDSHEAQIILISSGIEEDNAELRQAVLYAAEQGVILISAAGNDGDEAASYPAAYPSVISVGAVNDRGEPAAFSQKSEGITIMAPGENLYAVSIKNGSFFEQCSGTSYACSYVAALAARLLGAHPDMSPEEFKWILQNTGTDIGQKGYDAESGFGILNAEKALAEFETITASPPVPFNDVFLSDWFYEDVYGVYETGLMNGVSETMFAPEESLTRGMFVTVLYRAEGEPQTGENHFADVSSTDYFAKAVSWAKETGLVLGISETEFAPQTIISREQMVTILYRYARYKTMDVSVGESTNILSYEDFMHIAEYAIPAMQWACGEGLLYHENGSLEPKENAKRAQVAMALNKLMEE